MSWQATSWAKETTGHRTLSTKAILMIIADYADPDTWTCWPSQAKLAGNANCSVRTIQRSIEELEILGFISTVRKGNQHQPTLLRLNGSVSYAQTQAHATSEPANLSPAQVNPTAVTSEPDIGVALGDKEETIGSVPHSSERVPAAPKDCLDRFFKADNVGDQVGAVVDLWKLQLSPREKGHLGALIKKRGHGKDVWDAAVSAFSARGSPVEYMERTLSNGRQARRKDTRSGQGFSADDADRARRYAAGDDGALRETQP